MSRAVAPHVVHIAPALFGREGLVGGGERYVLELAKAMAEHAPTTLVSFGPTPRRERIGRLDIEVIANWLPVGRFRVDPINPALLSRLAQAEVIHAHQSFTTMTSLALAYGRSTGRPVFTTHLGGGGVGLQDLIDVSHWFAGHLHISKFSREVLGHADMTKADVIYGGVDTRRFHPDATAERTGEVLFVGRLLPHKGINYLIEAIDEDTPLTVIGGRWWRRQDAFHSLLKELAQGKRVSFLEDCDDDALVGAYQRALCVVLPSVYTTVFGENYRMPELLGQTLLEGMACGLPAICTAVGSMPEVVEDGVTGFVVPPNDPAALADRIAWLKSHPAEARAMGEAGRRRVLEHFCWDRVVKRCLSAYAEGLKGSPRRAATPFRMGSDQSVGL